MITRVQLSFRVNFAAQQVTATAHYELPQSAVIGGAVRLCFSRGDVVAVSVNDEPTRFTYERTRTAALSLVSRSHGLEGVSAALHAAARAPPELCVFVTADACAASAFTLDVVYAVGGGGLFALHDGSPFCSLFPLTDPPYSRTHAGTIFPSFSDPACRWTGGITVSIDDTDASGLLLWGSASAGIAGSRRLPLLVECASTAACERTAAGRHFPIGIPLPSSAIGFVVGPLTRFRRSTGKAPHALLQPSVLPASTASASSSSSSGVGKLDAVQPPLQAPAAAPRFEASFACDPALCVPEVVGLHAAYSKRPIYWMSDFLASPFPFTRHSHVFLPPSVHPAHAVLSATPTGVCPPSIGGSSLLYSDASALNSGRLAGMAVYADEALTDTSVIDASAATSRALAHSIASAWFGAALTAASWRDEWLIEGLAGYTAAQFLRSQRGETEYSLDLMRAAEVVAQLEEQYPRLGALCPRAAHPAPASPSSTASAASPAAAAVASQSTYSAAASSSPSTAAAASSANSAAAGVNNSDNTLEDPLAIEWHPLRRRYVAAKAPLVLHMLATRIGEANWFRILRLLARRATSATALSGRDVALSLGLDVPDAADGAALPPPAAALSAAAATAAVSSAALSTEGLISLVSAVVGPHARSAVDDFFSQWIRDMGVPHMIAGVHVSRKSNAVEIVVEQLVRPGSRLFSGALTVHIAERADTSSGSGGGGGGGRGGDLDAEDGAEVWEHTLQISTLRAVFTLPCHTKAKRSGQLNAAATAAAVAALLPDTHRKGSGMRRRGGGASTLDSQQRDNTDPSIEQREDDGGGNAVAAAAAAAALGSIDDVNNTQVLWVRFDPGGAWALKRLLVVGPPVLFSAQLVGVSDTVDRIDAVTSLGACGCPDSVYTPGSNDRDVWPTDAFPYVQLTSPAEDEAVARVLSSPDTTASVVEAGFTLRPLDPTSVPSKLAAIVCDLDPTGSTLRVRDDGSGELHVVSGNHAASSVVLARRGRQASVATAHRQSTVPAPGRLSGHVRPRTESSAPSGSSSAPIIGNGVGAQQHSVGLNFRLRCAAAAALSRWSSGHLPCASLLSGGSDGGSAARLPLSACTFTGLRMLLATYKALYYRRSSAAAAAVTSSPSTSESASSQVVFGSDNNASVLSELRSQQLVVESEASSGTPAPITVTSLADFTLRQSLLCAIANVRDPEGATPTAVLLFLSRVLRAYDNSGLRGGIDDGPLLAFLVLGLAQAAVAAPRDCAFASTVAADIRATLALELSELPPTAAAAAATASTRAVLVASTAASAALSGPVTPTPARASSYVMARVTYGTVSAACVTALAHLESRGVCDAPLTLPLLRCFVMPTHGTLGGAVVSTPPRLRLAAFVGLARAYLVERGGSGSGYNSDGELDARAREEWYIRASELVSFAVACARSPDDPRERTLGNAMLFALYTLHIRSDSDRGPSELDGGHSPALILRFEAELRAAFIPGSSSSSSSSSTSTGNTAPVASPAGWQAGHAVLDLGFLDCTADGTARCGVPERRWYGVMRVAPSSRGALALLATPSLRGGDNDGEAAESSGEYDDGDGGEEEQQQSCSSRARAAAEAPATGLWSLLLHSLQQSPSLLDGSLDVGMLYHLFHGVWGLAPPPAWQDSPVPNSSSSSSSSTGGVVVASSSSSSSSSSSGELGASISTETVVKPLDAVMRSRTSQRRLWLCAIHAEARRRHTTYCRMYAEAVTVREATAFYSRSDELGEELGDADSEEEEEGGDEFSATDATQSAMDEA